MYSSFASVLVKDVISTELRRNEERKTWALLKAQNFGIAKKSFYLLDGIW